MDLFVCVDTRQDICFRFLADLHCIIRIYRRYLAASGRDPCLQHRDGTDARPLQRRVPTLWCGELVRRFLADHWLLHVRNAERSRSFRTILNNVDDSESIDNAVIRVLLEDPEPSVRTAAKRSALELRTQERRSPCARPGQIRRPRQFRDLDHLSLWPSLSLARGRRDCRKSLPVGIVSGYARDPLGVGKR
jgi:hypothetical protein